MTKTERQPSPPRELWQARIKLMSVEMYLLEQQTHAIRLHSLFPSVRCLSRIGALDDALEIVESALAHVMGETAGG